MEFKTMLSNSSSRRRSCAGFTLSELMIGIGLAGIIVVVICALSLYSGFNFACIANYTDMDSNSINAMDRFTRDIRSSNGASNITSSTITLNTDSGVPITYAYSSGTRKLVRTQGGSSLDVLTECDTLQFQVYQRTPISGTFTQFDADNINETKVVFVTWNCSRTVFGRKITTDSASAGRVVIRVN